MSPQFDRYLIFTAIVSVIVIIGSLVIIFGPENQMDTAAAFALITLVLTSWLRHLNKGD